MAEIVITFLIESLTTKLQNEVRLLINIRPQVKSITDELDRIKSFLRAAEEKEDSHSNNGLGVSLKQLRGVAHDIEDSVDEFYLRFSDQEAIGFRSGSVSWWIGKPFRLIKNLKARRRITLDIEEAVTRVRSIVDGMQWFVNAQLLLVPRSSGGDGSSGKRIESRSDALLLEEADLVGIGENRKAMIEWLLNRDNDSGRCVISVAGTGGLGKTTLVRKVYEDPRVKKRFKVHAWVTVTRSEKSNKDLLRDLLREVFRVIGKPVPAEMNDYDMDELRENIKNLLMLSRYLIILDDVWGTSAWDLIRLSLPKSKKFGSKVVITTRSFDVAHHACAERRDWVFELKPLEEKESWELFCRKAFCGTTNGTCPEHLEGLCRCVLRSCDGLPLAIVTIGAVLGAKDEKEREEKLAGMCQNVGPEMDDNSRPLDSMMRVLALSFNDLPYYLKACFLYLSLFPAKLGVEMMRLIRLWIAEGFIPEREGKSLEEVAEGYFKELLDRSLVHVTETTTDGRIKSCKTHELLRTLAISKAKEQDFAEIAREKDDKWSDKPRRLSVCSTSQNGGNSRVSKLRTLLVFMVEEEEKEEEEEEEDSRPEFSLSALFPGRRFRLLKILDLRGLPIKRFPRETVKLYHLRYLSLRETSVEHIPSWIKKLQNLETLDLKQTKVSKLPLEVLTLRKLRHLLIYNYKIRSYVHFNKKTGVKAPQGIGKNLRSLQKLCFVEANQEIVREVGEMSQLRRLGIIKLIREDGAVLCSSIEKLVKLQSLSITSVDKDTVIDVSHVAHIPESLQRIFLNGRLEKMPLWIKSLRNLAILFLKWSRLKEDPLVHLQDLPNLVHLEFLKVFEGESLHFKEGGFPKLKLLGLDKLKQLKSMTIDIGVMPFLEKMVIQRCKELKNVPVGIEHLRNLKVIEFFDMPDELVMKLRPDGGEDYRKVDHVPAVYSSYWSKDGWDVYSVDRFMEKDNSQPGNTNTATKNQPCALWKV